MRRIQLAARRRSLALSIAVLGLLGCSGPVWVNGPQPPPANDVTVVEIMPLVDIDQVHTPINSRLRIEQVFNSGAFSMFRWNIVEESEFVPLYSIRFIQEDRTVSQYWLGTNSYPPRFPCYSLCSGWWVGSKLPDGTLLRKGLIDTKAMPLVAELFSVDGRD